MLACCNPARSDQCKAGKTHGRRRARDSPEHTDRHREGDTESQPATQLSTLTQPPNQTARQPDGQSHSITRPYCASHLTCEAELIRVRLRIAQRVVRRGREVLHLRYRQVLRHHHRPQNPKSSPPHSTVCGSEKVNHLTTYLHVAGKADHPRQSIVLAAPPSSQSLAADGASAAVAPGRPAAAARLRTGGGGGREKRACID